jgi:hypothetical protein
MPVNIRCAGLVHRNPESEHSCKIGKHPDKSESTISLNMYSALAYGYSYGAVHRQAKVVTDSAHEAVPDPVPVVG